MFEISFDENLEIGKKLKWSVLKYGFCSYFALAYANKYPSYDRFLAVMEYDDFLEKEYVVHFLVIDENVFIDAYGTYDDWEKSVNDITDIEFMDLRTKEVSKEFVIEMIKQDMGFDEELYDTIRNFVNEAYEMGTI